MGWAFRVVMWTCDRESSRQSGKQSWNSRCISDGMSGEDLDETSTGKGDSSSGEAAGYAESKSGQLGQV